MNKKKIVFFLKEYGFAEKYFSNIFSKLENKYLIKILHTSTLENSNILDSKYYNQDISFWPFSKLKKIILEEKIEYIALTNIRSLLDINIIALANDLNVSVVYIEHGMTLDKIIVFKRSNLFHSFKKYIIYCSNTIINIIISNNKNVIVKNIYKAFLKADYSNLRLNKAMLYSSYSFKVLNKIFDLSKTKIIYSGYPIAETINEINKLNKCKVKKQVLFIHQPLILDKFSDISINEEISILNEMCNKVISYGYDFILKLHPRSDFKLYKKLFKGKISDTKISIENLISESSIIIGYFSTALLMALKLNKTLLIFNQKGINTEEINVFKTDNNYFESVDELEMLLTSLDNDVLKINQISFMDISGEINTHSDRYKKLLSLLDI